MNSREILLRSFRNEPVLRRALAPFIYTNFVKAFFKDQDVDVIQGTIDVYRHFGFDLMHRNINVRYDETYLDDVNWRVTVKRSPNGRDTSVITKIKTPERVLTQIKQERQLSEFRTVAAITEYFIKDEEDFNQFVKYQPPVPLLSLPELERAKELVGSEGVLAPWIWGVFNYLAEHRRLEDLLLDPLLNPGFFRRMADYFLARLLDHVRQILAKGVDVLSYSGNLATGTVVGPDFFRQYIFDYEKRLIDAIQERGVIVLYHNCGDARTMTGVYNDLGFAAYESFTEPPYGDSDIHEVLSGFNRDITLVGNIDQIDFLRKATPGEVRQKAAHILHLAKDRPSFILGTSDFLEEDTPHANLFALREALQNNP